MIMYSSTCTDIQVCTWLKTLELVVYMIMYSSTCTDMKVCTFRNISLRIEESMIEFVVCEFVSIDTCFGIGRRNICMRD
jgi:hypothetical protein